MKISIKTSLALSVFAGILLSSCDKDENPDTLVNFETLTLNPDSYWNGSDGSGSFKVKEATFENFYDTKGFWWNGFAYSNKHDIKTAGYGNQYSCYALKDTASSNTFVVANPSFSIKTIDFDKIVYDVKLKVTNTTYAFLSMKYGDKFGKKFGGADSTESDWFKLAIIGIDNSENPTDTANVYLADFRYAGKNSTDYIVDQWIPVDLSKLGEVKKIKFELSSSDNGNYGMNTPGYFCLDDLEYKLVSNQE
jgi:hypothetical protein